MSPTGTSSGSSPMIRALETIRKLRAQLDERTGKQPLAVIGVGLRFPGGAHDLDSYWEAVVNGRDLVRTMPDNRKGPFTGGWDALPNRGGYLDEVLDFDAAFFGISPREARAIDPQQRLLLEVAWEALEDAALPPKRKNDEGRVGAYIGVSGRHDYYDWCPEMDAHWATGTGHSFTAGRIAYTLGFTGPAVAVDTACSSGLTAVHQAGRALRLGECDVALAGAVNLVLAPGSTQAISTTSAFSPDGRCKTFDARANGYVRGEGCGVLVLKRLDDARRDGDRVLAVIHGSAVNQDGRSSGFTAPNVLSQIALIEEALADAGLTPADIGMVEAHGTGTSLGDPIEMEAIATALGRRNGGSRLHVGSVKTNIGHLEAASGIAGLIKGIACLRYGVVPPLLNFQTLNPRIDIDGTGITLSTEALPWTNDGSGSCVGVSSFGLSGTNAHVIIGPDTAETGEVTETTAPGMEVSAASPEALRALADAYRHRLVDLPEAEYPAFAYTATHGRARHALRARITAATRDEAVAALRALADDAPSPAVTVTEGAAADDPPALPRRVIGLPAYPWQRVRCAPSYDSAGPAAAPASESEPESEPETRSAAGLYELGWLPVGVPAAPPSDTLVLAGDDTETLGLLAASAHEEGRTGFLLTSDPKGARPGFLVGALPHDDGGWREFWAARPDTEPVTLVLAMRGGEPPASLHLPSDLVEHGAELCSAVATAVRALDDAAPPGRVFVLTLGSRQVSGSDTIVPSGHGLLNGLGPVLGLELPGAWGATIDLPARPGPADAATALRILAVDEREDCLAVRGERAYGARLRETRPGYAPDLPVSPEASYIVSGGLGGVGRAVTADLVRRGARHLLLLGRTEKEQLSEAAADHLAWLRSLGADVRYHDVDLDDGVALGASLTSALADMPKVRGVVHTAGVLPYARTTEITAADFAEGLRGKYSGAWWLHLALDDQPLDFFVQTSSTSAQWGNEGRAAYAAANAALDLLAAYRGATEKPATSIAYGAWNLDGMADADGRAGLARMGVLEMPPGAGCAALTATAPGADGLLAATTMDWPRFVEVMSSLRQRAFFDEVVESGSPAGRGQGAEASAQARAELLDLSERARADAVRDRLRGVVAATLGHADADAVREDMGFFDLGLDSIMAVDLARDLTRDFGVTVRVNDVFNHATVARLASHLTARLIDPSGTLPDTPPARARLGHVAQSAPQPPPPHSADTEPVAIVGMAGRFPGADSVEEFWELLREGRDTVGPVPADRWDGTRMHDSDPLTAGRISTDQGGFLSDIASFDAEFFNIPAREAESLDPQQRLLLECAWHALEDAGTDPTSLNGSRSGVFVGITNSDYARLLERGGLSGLDAYYGSGTALNVAAGRIAFLLGLHGPAMAIDTACSSSLVAMHNAVQSLRLGESDLALVGGVNVIADPTCSVAVSRAHMLSPDGRCKPFSADANGFVRSEGCGVLVLKRLSDAQRDADRVLAVVHGSAVNSDGASSGLTVPNGSAQEAVISAALADAGVRGADISYLEAHGTGTALGDPIEVSAAWNALGRDREPDRPLLIGSVKSNIGHCESASGIAGIMKTVLALREGGLPANLHSRTPNPHIPWDEMNVQVVDAPMPWRTGTRPRLAGVSSFGFSGANAHVVIGEAPPSRTDTPASDTHLVPISAPDPTTLERLTGMWRDRIATADPAELAGLAATAGAGRAHFPERRALLAKSKEELLAQLDSPAPTLAKGAPRVAFLFTGAGSQYFGMGAELYAAEPVFRARIDDCSQILEPHLGVPLPDLMFAGADEELIDRIRYTQPATAAIELGLAALWESWGVRPSVVTGHSVGECAAAIFAGVLSLEEGLTLIAHRARLMEETERGRMLSLAAPMERVTGWIADTSLDVAAVNGPESIVVAGAPEEIEAVAARAEAEDVKARELAIFSAAHSRMIEPVVPRLRSLIAGMDHRRPRTPIISNLTGALAEPDTYNAEYWCRHIRQPVRFHEGARSLIGFGVDVALEVGPGQTLVNMLTAADLVLAGDAVSSLQRGERERTALLTAARVLYERGQDIDWRALHANTGVIPVPGPRYPFAPARHWTKTTPAAPVERPAAARRHWGEEFHSPGLKGRVFAFERTADFPRYLPDHRIEGKVLVPASAHLSTLLSALADEPRPLVLRDVVWPAPFIIADGEQHEGRLTVGPGGGDVPVEMHSLNGSSTWRKHMTARLVRDEAATPLRTVDRDEFAATAERRVSGADFYSFFREIGYTLGRSFRWIAEAWVRGDEALIRFEQPPLPVDPAEYELYPGLIDSCFQMIAPFMVDEEAPEWSSLAIPFTAERLAFPSRLIHDQPLWGTVRALRSEPLPRGRLRVETADLHLFTSEGDSVLVAEGFRVRGADRAVLSGGRIAADNAYELVWRPRPAASPRKAAGHSITLLGGDHGVGNRIASALRGLGHVVALVDEPSATDDCDLIIDTRFAAPVEAAPAREALHAATGLAKTLRAAPRRVPYALVADGGSAAAPIRESLYGLLAALETEDAERALMRVTLETGWTEHTLIAALINALDDGVAEPRIAVSGDGVSVARLTPVVEPVAADGVEPHAGGAALITGGLGALGLATARALAHDGVTAITLMARSEPDETALRVAGELTETGVEVTIVRGDATDPSDIEEAVALAGKSAPLSIVCHLAGATADAAFDRLTPEAFEKAFHAKAVGGEALADALQGHDLAALVLFSSAAGVLGSAGQVNYAAANGYLDGVAVRLRAAGLPAVAVDWGPWKPADRDGMAAGGALARQAEQAGVGILDDERAAALLRLAVAGNRPRLVAVAADFDRYRAVLSGHRRASLLTELGSAVSGDEAADAAGPDSGAEERGWLLSRLAATADADRAALLHTAIGDLVGRTLGEDAPVDPQLGFEDMGLDSIMVMDLSALLENALDIELPVTVAIDYPTVVELARYLDELVHPQPTGRTGEADGPMSVDEDPAALSDEELIEAIRRDLDADVR